MADNLELNAGSGGSTLATAEVTFSGDTAEVQICGVGFVSGVAESYSVALASAGAGAVGTGVQRVTLASDDPAVAHLANVVTAVQLIDNAVSGAGFNVTQLAGAAVPIGAGLEATAVRVTIATDSTGVLSVDDNGSSLTIDGTVTANLSATDNAVLDAIAASVAGTLTVGSHAVTNAGTFAVQVDGAALASLQLIDNAVSGAGFNITQLAGAAVPIGAGLEATAVRVTLATDSTGVVSVDDNASSLTVDTTGTSGLEVVQVTAADLNCTEASASAIKTAVEIMDDWDDGSDHCEIVGAAAEDAAVAGAPVLTAGRYDSTERATQTGDATTLATSAQGWMMVGNQSSYVFDGATRCQVKRAAGVAATGTVSMVAAVPGYQIRVLSLAIIATSAAPNTVRVHNADNDLLGNSGNAIPIAVDADGDNVAGLTLPWNIGGWFQTDADNEALDITLSAAQDVIYCVTYIEVT